MTVRFWIRALLTRGALRAQIDEEIQYHIRERADGLIKRGHSASDAHRMARKRFGDVERTRAACQELYMVEGTTGGDGLMWEFVTDLRHTLRSLGRERAFAAAVILTLGLGIGANAAIFSVLNGVLLRPLPYDHPEQLVRLWQADRANGTRFENFSGPDYFDLLERNNVFAGLSATESRTLTLNGPEGEPTRLRVVAASANLMSLLGTAPSFGRSFVSEEDVPGGERVAMLGYGLWVSRYGRDEGVLGRSVVLDGVSFRIVGVAPRGLEYPYAGIELWLPLQAGPTTRSRGQHNFGVVARIRADRTVEQANADVAAIAAALETEFAAENEGRDMWAQPLRASVVGSVQSALYLLGGAVTLVLLIACVNVANLLIVRASGREREVAVRLALGAGRTRVLRQFLTENAVLAGLGGLVGLAIAVGGVRALLAASPASLPRQANIGVDATVLAFTLGASLLTGLACGLLPAIRASRVDLRSPLSDGGARGTGSSRRSGRFRNALVVLEVAMAVMLVTSAGLLIRTMASLDRVDPGFDADGVLTAAIQLPASRYPQSRDAWPDYPEVLGFQRALEERVRLLPGVSHAAIALNGPADPGWTTRFGIAGRTDDEIPATEEVRIRVASSGYVEAGGLELVRGRLLTERDNLQEEPPVLLINEAMARRYFLDENPLGATINNWGVDREVVGVVRDVRFMGLGEPGPPAVYPTFSRMPFAAFLLVVRTTGDPMALVPGLRAAVAELDRDLALGQVRSVASSLEASTAPSRFNAMLLGLFAALSLVLAAVGIYGVVSYRVRQCTHEIGVRLSIGASGSEIARQVVGQSLRLAIFGLVLGIAGTAASGKLLSSLLFGVNTFDLANLGLVVALCTAVALVSSYLPARRAGRLDPVSAMRGE